MSTSPPFCLTASVTCINFFRVTGSLDLEATISPVKQPVFRVNRLAGKDCQKSIASE